jgi:hypothetical protein
LAATVRVVSWNQVDPSGDPSKSIVNPDVTLAAFVYNVNMSDPREFSKADAPVEATAVRTCRWTDGIFSP